MNNNKFDWKSIPEVNEQINWNLKLREAETEVDQNAGNMLRPSLGKELRLRVRVTDVDLAQMMFIGMYGGQFTLPGLEILELGQVGNLPAIIEYLESQTSSLKSKLEEQRKGQGFLT